MQMAMTKMSSKGQIVIPVEMRGDIVDGEQIVVLKDGDQLLLKTVSVFSEQLKDDLKFSQRIREAWRSYDRGGFKKLPADKFLELLEKC